MRRDRRFNKTCFNGLYRENSKGGFNVPIGSYKSLNICNADVLREASTALYQVNIGVQSFESILYQAKPGDLVYFDPPYQPVSKTSKFTGYTKHPFLEPQQIQLRNIFAELKYKGVKVLLSNSDCGFTRELYSGFNIHNITAARSVNCDPKKRFPVPEILVTSF
jgi:DNA adenine methylase